MTKISCIVLEDDPLFLAALKVYLSEMDFIDLLGAYSDPVKGAMAITKSKPDLLLLDIEMPYLDGFETIATLDVRPKIMVISGHVSAGELPPVDIDKFVSKSNIREPEDLEKAIREVMGL